MKHIVSLVYSSMKNSFETTLSVTEKQIRLSQFAVGFDSKLMRSLLETYDGQCDVIAISGFHPPVHIGRNVLFHPDSQRIMSIPKTTPVVSGFVFKNTYVPWALRNYLQENGNGAFENRRIAFVSGLVDHILAESLGQITEQTLYGDPYFHFSLPAVLKGTAELQFYAQKMAPFLKRRKLDGVKSRIDFRPHWNFPRFKEFLDADIVVATSTLLERCELSWLKGKIIVLDTLTARLKDELARARVSDVIHFLPDLELVRNEPRLNYATIEAVLQCFKGDDESVEQDDILDFIEQNKLKPKLLHTLAGPVPPKRKFAFIIHPLSISNLFLHPALRPFQQVTKPVLGLIEKGITRLPGMRYGKITGIRSDFDGTGVDGIIYTIFDTPKQLLRADPEDVYDKLVAITEKALAEGADIIGLGAFTKIVGDAGVTVANRSPIPVTTGNSLSAASTLWAARVASEKMGFLKPYKSGRRISGTAMIIGATGSIGAVSSKLLARVASRLIITGPRPEKLIELRDEINKLVPNTEVLIATNSSRYADECDLIVVSTSATDGNVLKLAKVKPGCVICDVSRPLSFTAEETMSRPDVLIIESGELHLPGLDVHISCDIGLDESVVYACLAETALLALERRYESFTLSRNINFQKVMEIYDMAKKHGARLASIRGPLGLITDQEIALCREHALKALGRT